MKLRTRRYPAKMVTDDAAKYLAPPPIPTKDQDGTPQPPPSYSSATSNDTPPAYAPPSAYRIGAQTLSAPLVTVQQLKAHLCLLRAFKNLRTAIEEGTDPRIPDYARDLEAVPRWGWFVGLAVERSVWFLPWHRSPLTGSLGSSDGSCLRRVPQ